MSTPAASIYNGSFEHNRESINEDMPALKAIRKTRTKPKRKSSVKKRRENLVGGFRHSTLAGGVDRSSVAFQGGRNQTMVDTGDQNRSKNMQEYLPDSIVSCISSWEAKNSNFNDESLQLPKFDIFNTVCLFIDLAGFTSLTESLNNKLGSLGLNARAAIEALVEKLNELYSKMLNIILKHGGDATRFAGDAIEVIWPFVPNANIDIIPQVSDNTIVAALKCSLALSRSVTVLFDEVEFDFKKLAKYYKEDFISKPGQSIREKFKVRIGVGIGEVVILHIGGADDNVMKCRHEYICFGPAISQAHDCERNAKPGETVVHTGDFKRLRLMKRFRTEEINDSDYSVLTHQKHQKKRSKKESTINPVKHKVRRMRKTLSHNSGIHLKEQIKIMNMSNNLSTNVERMLWRYVPIAAVPYIGEAHHEEWLPEFRTVTTLFCNLGISPDEQLLPILEEANRPNLLDDFQEMFLSIQKCVFRFEGTINKFLVDKGSVIMIVFGLPPFGHVDDAKRGVLCAKGIMKILTSFHKELAIKSDDKPTVGVTTGTVLCGVIGSYAYYSKHRVSTKGGKNWGTLKANQVEKTKHARREYSIIGDSVNVASRLMVLARQLEGSLLIDEATVSSLRQQLLFIGPEYHKVKGKTKDIAVYQLAPSGERYRSKTELHKASKEGFAFFGSDEDLEFEVSNIKAKDKHIMFGKSMRMKSRGLILNRFFSTSSLQGSRSQTYPSTLQEISSIKTSFCDDENTNEASQVQFIFLEGQVGVGKSHLLFHALEKDDEDEISLFTAFGNAFKSSKEGNMFGTMKFLLMNMLETIKEETEQTTEEIVVEALKEASRVIDFSSKPVVSRLKAGNKLRKEAVRKLSSLSPKTRSILKDVLGNCFEESKSYLDVSAAHSLSSFVKGGLHIETIDCILEFVKRKNLFGYEAALLLSPVVELVTALFVGFAAILSKLEKPLVCAIENSENMDLLCWLVLVQICMFYSATKALFVLSRTTLLLKEDDMQIFKSQDTVSAYNCNSIFGKFSSTKLQSQHKGILHYREKFEAYRTSVRFLRLSCSEVFTKAILSAHFDVASIDSSLLRFLETKTNGNPLFLTDAINFYVKLGLVTLETDDKGRRSIKVCNLKEIYTAGPPPSVEGVCGAMLDRLSPIQQLLLKTCATCAVITRDKVVQRAKQQKPDVLNSTVIPNVFSMTLAISRFPIIENAAVAAAEFTELLRMGIIRTPPTKRSQGSGHSQIGASRSPPTRRATVLTTFRNRLTSIGGAKDEQKDEYCFRIPWMLDSLLHRMLSSQRKKIEKGNYHVVEDDSKTRHNETELARDVINNAKSKQHKKSMLNRLVSSSDRSSHV